MKFNIPYEGDVYNPKHLYVLRKNKKMMGILYGTNAEEALRQLVNNPSFTCYDVKGNNWVLRKGWTLKRLQVKNS